MVKLRKPLPLTSNGLIDIDLWIDKLKPDRTQAEIDLIEKAIAFFKENSDALENSFENVLKEALEIADILVDLGLDAETLAASILYALQKKQMLLAEKIQTKMGASLFKLLSGIQKIDSVSKNEGAQKSENLRRLLLAIVEDVRVVLIKLAERIILMRNAVHIDEAARQKLALETESIYVPLANRLGIGQVKWELEDFAFRFLNSFEYKQIANFLDEKRIDRESYIQKVQLEIDEALKNQTIQAEVTGRVKHIYSIWKKMQRKGVGYHEIYDVRAIRILVHSIRECYTALGIVHTLWKNIPKEFDDYIANPKENGYRSLHTAVIGPAQKTIEIQIRTFEMHEQAELGVAAHWRYKERVVEDSEYESRLMSLRQVLRWQDEWPMSSHSSEYPSDIFSNRVYVLTPKGKVIDLQEGATVLDFAYHIHTEVGNRCKGAKVNGRMVPLTHALKSGDRVEILTSKTGTPSRDWLIREFGYLNTSRARSKVAQWFKRQDKETQPALDPIIPAMPEPKPISPIILHPKTKNTRETDIEVLGVKNLLYQIARCCKPVPGDEIIGYITQGKGISIHKKDCMNVLQNLPRKPNRYTSVAWGSKTESVYLVDIAIAAVDREGLLNEISSIISTERIDIISIMTTINKMKNSANFKLTIEVSAIDLLNKIIGKIKQLPDVNEVKRV